jgi:CRISPR-associated protein Csx17
VSEHVLVLDGCNPEPLMGYLKALGILRLLSEQKNDAEVRGFWRDGVFILETPLGRDGLARFLLEEYSPTPLLAPWNGGSGFYVKLDLERFLNTGGKEIEFKGRDAIDAIDALEASSSERLASYREQIGETKRALTALAERVDFGEALAASLGQWPQARTKPAQKKVKDEATKVLNTMLLFRSGEITFSLDKAAKDEFVSDLRGKVLTDDGLGWLDAALAMRTGQKKNRAEAPTLGSGGNIGNSDFSARFAQILPAVVPLGAGAPVPEGSAAWLNASIYGVPAPSLQKISVDQFDPGKAGGANGTQGMEAAPMLNPWDYVLMMEGALVLAGNTSRRLGVGRSVASFPFVVESSAAGHGSIGNDSTRGEAWLPLWSAPALFNEVKFLLSEGRAEVGRTRARSGLTFAQAVAGLGIDRGIGSFVRYEFQERLGQSYIATPLGRFQVPGAPLDGIELVRALNDWLESFRHACRTKKEGAKTDPPLRFPSAQRRIESAVFDFCRYGGAGRLAHILAALGGAERELAVGDMNPEKRRTYRPLGGLSTGWLKAANDGSAEFGLARGIASLNSGTKGTGPIRRYLEPVELKGSFWAWGERGGHVVWSGAKLARNLGSLLVRRLIDAEQNGEPLPPVSSPFPVALDDIAAFLGGAVDDAKLDDLLWGLSLIERYDQHDEPNSGNNAELPSIFALLKLTLLPGRLEWFKLQSDKVVLRINSPKSGHPPGGLAVKPELAILAKLRAGDIQGACDVAARRLRSSGFSIIGNLSAGGARRAIDWSAADVQPERLLAALAFPIPNRAVNQLGEVVLRYPSTELSHKENRLGEAL